MTWLVFLFVNNRKKKEEFQIIFQEADDLPKRLPKQPIYIHVESETPNYHQLTGQFNFDSVRNNAAAFVRAGGKVDTLDCPPYYLVYIEDSWYVTDKNSFEENEESGWMSLVTNGLFFYKYRFSYL